MKTHAALPFADKIENSLYRIYFSTRDSQNRAHTGFVEIDINNTKQILYLTEKPILSPGELGTFDDSGIMASSLVNYQGRKYLYYTGWNIGVTVPFRWSIGLAISEDGGKTFTKKSKAPIMDRSDADPLFVASPTVILDNGIFKMWYISSTKWINDNGKLRAPYFIKYAESENGIDWKKYNTICVDLEKNETGVGRASILKENDTYQMWYSVSTNSYRIGYATSKDGLRWNRRDELAGVDISEQGWDSQSIEYSNIFVHDGTKYMLYNGNEYGKSGFGYAVLEPSKN
jgi:predicted GH43/DUF377 family glycosyl hydrolase